MGLKFSLKHKWYYKFAQQPDEVLVSKQFDNFGRGRACPHTAFRDEEAEDGGETRESIEVRAMLFWPEFGRGGRRGGGEVGMVLVFFYLTFYISLLTILYSLQKTLHTLQTQSP